MGRTRYEPELQNNWILYWYQGAEAIYWYQVTEASQRTIRTILCLIVKTEKESKTKKKTP